MSLVVVWFNNQSAIKVDNNVLDFDLVDDNISAIVYDESLQFNPVSAGSICYKDGTVKCFDQSEYKTIVQPYVDLFNKQLDKIKAEQQAKIDEQNKIENVKTRAKQQLNQQFEQQTRTTHIQSSLGFEVNADAVAMQNVSGLLITIENATVKFCDYNNEFHELTKDQLQTLQLEIIQNAQQLYNTKWKYRTQIDHAKDADEVNQILQNISW